MSDCIKLHIGQVWRKHGPCDWFRIVKFLLPDKPDHDGALPGVIVQHRTWRGRWTKKWFYPAANEQDFIKKYLSDGFYFEDNKAVNHER